MRYSYRKKQQGERTTPQGGSKNRGNGEAGGLWHTGKDDGEEEVLGTDAEQRGTERGRVRARVRVRGGRSPPHALDTARRGWQVCAQSVRRVGRYTRRTREKGLVTVREGTVDGRVS